MIEDVIRPEAMSAPGLVHVEQISANSYGWSRGDSNP
jgi:hypothetical protein